MRGLGQVTPSTVERIRMRLISDEGVVLHAYQDSLGYWSLGVGRCIDKRRGCGISHQEALYLLDNVLDVRLSDIIERWPAFLKLDPVRQTVIASMAYQLGLEGLASFTDTLSAMWRGDYRAASEHMIRSKWAQADSPARAYRLAQMMDSGRWD